MRDFNDALFFNEINRFVGSGGEILIKGPGNANAPRMRIDVGDRLIGIGITHMVERFTRPPGPESFNFFKPTAAEPGAVKMALRAFEVSAKSPNPSGGIDFQFKPLSPIDYSDTVDKVSNGAVHIDSATIPQGTVILSFLSSSPAYTLATIANSPTANWVAATTGARHWNVGMGKPDDFWEATFPADDLSLLQLFASSDSVGSIRFGLSLLPGSAGALNLQPVPITRISGATTTHDFCLSGAAAGTQGLNTPFPIGLRTAITFHPRK